MGEREKKLEAAGYPLDRGPKEGTVIDLLSVLGDTVYASGQVPFDAGVLTSTGKVPSQVSVEDATKAAALCAANILRAVVSKLGSLDRIERVVRVTGYVNADPDFTDCHLVINGATDLLKAVFGPEHGRHARTALGMGQLPLGTSVEVEAIFQLKR
jgi:enamine deaminase RidA (YjgF/YER057c/UK114 family)